MVVNDEADTRVPWPTTDRPGVFRRGGVGGREAGATTEWRWRGTGCVLARAARAVGEGSGLDAEAWRDKENAPRVGRPIGRINVDDIVADVPHTLHHTRSRVGSRGSVFCLKYLIHSSVSC
jgi:hypothetical protein